MISSDCKDVVLFISERKGILLQKGQQDVLSPGEIYNEFNMEFFTDYNKPITVTFQNA